MTNEEIKDFMNWLIDNGYLSDKTVRKKRKLIPLGIYELFKIYYEQYIRDKKITQLGI